ncbi:hypothetical protein BBK36DRAFT_1160398 [Trichoderma citrinoviride]|uniref:Lincomycin-condensing protein lmbA n=1 Tax=Trichoderma citrinoviride TaxID=58853 RepID=A0A2T4B793_9HYPO|nr:hypothetical protein BBK36DRAFT_1160398 [Trichoderma citrinoviride]PTB65195.1 hypothetical protein BBK36DRAFT_1160398 [Trichoderma citrinoviride]
MNFFRCLCDDDFAPPPSIQRNHGLITEKPRLQSPPPHKSVEETADNIIDILLHAEKSGAVLSAQLDDAVSATGWSEWLAKNVLKKLEGVLKSGRDKMGPAMAEAYDQACEAAEVTFSDLFAYVKEHPVEIAATVLLSLFAFGVLVRLMPLMVELLGFTETGTTAGTFASWWESTYGGYIPKGSLFSYFQRLTMRWLRPKKV